VGFHRLLYLPIHSIHFYICDSLSTISV
jgi:hypothetical protein